MDKTALIYCRVSTTKQLNDWESLDNQEQACRTYCNKNNIQVIGVFKEAFTWKQSNRPVFNEAKKNAIKNKVNYFLVFDIDRFSREWYWAYTELKEKLYSRWIQLQDSKGVIWENQIVMENAIVDMSKYKWNIENKSEMAEMVYSAQAKIEWNKIIQRTIPREIQLEQEWYVVRQSHYGYINKKITTFSGRKTIQVEHPIEWQWVIEMFENRARWSLTDKEIVEELNLKWCKKRTGKELDVKYMQEIIVKPVYAGVISTKWTWNKAIRTPYEWLVSIDIWNKANRWKIKIIEIDNKEVQLQYNNWKDIQTDFPIIEKRKDYNPEYPYAKVFKCPHCEWDLTANTSTSRDWTFHYYYQCRWKNWVKHKTYTIKRDESHEKINTIFNSVKINDDVLKAYDVLLKEVYEERKQELRNDSENYDKSIKELEIQEKNIIANINKIIDFPELLESQNKELQNIKSEKLNIELKRKNAWNMSSLSKYSHYGKLLLSHINKLALQTDKPEIINLAFDIVFWWKIDYDNLNYHTHLFHSLPLVKPKKNPQNGDFSLNSKWQSNLKNHHTKHLKKSIQNLMKIIDKYFYILERINFKMLS